MDSISPVYQPGVLGTAVVQSFRCPAVSSQANKPDATGSVVPLVEKVSALKASHVVLKRHTLDRTALQTAKFEPWWLCQSTSHSVSPAAEDIIKPSQTLRIDRLHQHYVRKNKTVSKRQENFKTAPEPCY